MQGDGRAEHDLVARQGRRIDHHRAAQLVLDVGDHRLDLALALLGRMIFGVLGEVAVRARFLDRLDDRRTLDRFQVPHLVVQLAVALGQHRHLVGSRHLSSFLFKTPPAAPLPGFAMPERIVR